MFCRKFSPAFTGTPSAGGLSGGMACKIYHRQHKKYPDNISELGPNLLPAKPLDPFTGQPLKYHPKKDGFIVYSLGSNKKDDGGRMSMMTQAVMVKDDDWSCKKSWH